MAVRPHGEMQGGVEGELGTAFYVSGGSPGVGSAPRPLGPPVGIPTRVQEFLRKSLFDFPLPTATMEVSFQKNSGDPEKGRCM